MSRFTVITASVIISSVCMIAAGWKVYILGKSAGMMEINAKWNAEKDKQQKATANVSAKLEVKKNEAIKKSTKREIRVASDVGDARSTLYSLHRTTENQSVRLGDSCPSSSKAISTLTDVFQQCTAELVEMAAKADGHYNDTITMIEAWPSVEGR